MTYVEPDHSSDRLSQRLDDYVKAIPVQALDDPRRYKLWRYFIDNKQAIISGIDEKPKDKVWYNGNRLYFTTFWGGACCYAPVVDREHILDLMAEDIESQTDMYFNQIGYEDEGIRLVVDVDSNIVLTADEQRTLVVALEETLAEYYPSYAANPIPVYVARCGPRLKKDALSIALHMVVHVAVTIEQARQLLYSYRLRLLRTPTVRMEQLEIDAGIYKDTHRQVWLRPIYCSKVEDCPLCRGIPANSISCVLCNQKGRVVSKFTYVPAMYTCGQGPVEDSEFQRTHASWSATTRNYAIWSLDAKEHRTDFVKPPREPAYQADEQKLTKAGKPRKPVGGAPKDSRMVPTDNSCYDMLQDFLAHITWNGKNPWDGIRVTNVSVKGKRAFVNVGDAGSTTCLYADKDHYSSKIYFVVDKTKGQLIHHCFCAKPQYGCKTKKRIAFELSTTVIHKVFGDPEIPSLISNSMIKRPTNEKFDIYSYLKRRMEEHDDTDHLRNQQRLAKRQKQERIEATERFYRLATSRAQPQ